MRMRIAAALLTLIAALLWVGAVSADGPLMLEERTTSSLTVSWNWDGQSASAYELAWRARGDDSAAWRSVRKTAGQRRHTISGLEAGVHYIVRVRVLDSNDRSLATLQGAFATSSATAEGVALDPRLRRGLAERLTLELVSSRELCTAGTLTEISWEIAGGTPPYSLEIEGSPIAADADNVRINCGALTEAEADDEGADLAAKRITATVTDSRGVQQEAEILISRAVPATPPSSALVGADRVAVWLSWKPSPDEPTTGDVLLYVIRWRRTGTEGWSVLLRKAWEPHIPLSYARVDGLEQGEDYDVAISPVRHELEAETPEALTWSPTFQATTIGPPTGIKTAATHDTITVSWDPHPTGRRYTVSLRQIGGPEPKLSLTSRLWHTEPDAVAGQASRPSVVFERLPPNRSYQVWVASADTYPDEPVVRTGAVVSTTVAPVDWVPPRRGPQDLRATATHRSITVQWEHPYSDPDATYDLKLIHPMRSVPRWETTYGGVKTFTFDNLEPNLTYRVVVIHRAPIAAPQEITATTSPLPQQSTMPGYGWPFSVPEFAWPYLSRSHLYMTTDMWKRQAEKYQTNLSERLTLELASSRELCTAGTLTEVSWTIDGGTPPYTLHIDDAAVDANADNIRINCGALPTDPLTGELVARRTKTFRASVRDSRGVNTTATATVTLTTPPYLTANTALRYDTYDLTGAAASAGSYAFLTDADGAASVVTTYEGLRDGSTEGLLIHTADAQGVSQRSLYAAVATGDLFEWRQSYDCWVRYWVTGVKPDPPGAAARALLAVERASYAFTGCSGVISSDAVLIAWGSLPDLGGPSLAAPLRHGPFQIVPEGWDGAVEEDTFRPWPGNSYTNPVGTDDLAEARRLPYWRDPTLSAGWTLTWVSSGDSHNDPPHGYCALWANDRGYRGVGICGGFHPSPDRPVEASWQGGRGGVVETRTIAGRSSFVVYSPAGSNHNRYYSIQVWIYDPATAAAYDVTGYDWTLNGSNVDAVIAIARSLFES